MDGDHRQRFCNHCQRTVHNFSEMTTADVQSLLDSDERVCAKLKKRCDGSIVTFDGNKQTLISRRNWFGRLVAMAASVVSVVFLGGCRERELQETTGIIAPETVGEAIPVNHESMGGIGYFQPAPPLDDAGMPAAKSQDEAQPMLGRVVPSQPAKQ